MYVSSAEKLTCSRFTARIFWLYLNLKMYLVLVFYFFRIHFISHLKHPNKFIEQSLYHNHYLPDSNPNYTEMIKIQMMSWISGKSRPFVSADVAVKSHSCGAFVGVASPLGHFIGTRPSVAFNSAYHHHRMMAHFFQT